ncbi:MAG: DUF1161 domain-containing protein [Hydrogenophaga sp.]|nr:DUF1161 domain-containing protein [Hydrogenophaga sp.]
MSRRFDTRLVALTLALAAGPALADICEPLREHIEFQIASTGARDFAVVVVDVDDEVPGKLVGTCAHGTRKLVYVRAEKRRHTPTRVKPSVATASDDHVITECRDGTVVKGNASCTP